MNNDDLTPDWLRDIDLQTALDNLAYDIGVQAAKLTMLQQRVLELRVIVQEKEAEADE